MKKKSAFEKIMDGLNDAIAFAEGDRTRGVILKVEVQNVDIAAFADVLAFPRAGSRRSSASARRRFATGNRESATRKAREGTDSRDPAGAGGSVTAIR